MALVLVVDDDADCRNSMSDLLEMEGHSVISASNGREALDVLLRGNRPSLILLDLLMPVMGGVDFLSALERQPPLRDIQICILSGIDTLALPSDVLHLSKPVSADQLLDLVSHYQPEEPLARLM